MSKKQEFIDYVEKVMKNQKDRIEMPKNVAIYWNALKEREDVSKPLFTENGKLILNHMRNNLDTPMWKARDIAEGLFISSKTVAGAMRKLVSDGFVEKIGDSPSIYEITEKGKTIEII